MCHPKSGFEGDHPIPDATINIWIRQRAYYTALLVNWRAEFLWSQLMIGDYHLPLPTLRLPRVDCVLGELKLIWTIPVHSSSNYHVQIWTLLYIRSTFITITTSPMVNYLFVVRGLGGFASDLVSFLGWVWRHYFFLLEKSRVRRTL